MIKKDIEELLEYRKQLINSQYGNKSNGQSLDILDLEIPLIPELQEECATLQKELDDIKNKKRAAMNYIKTKKENIDKINCTHPLIFPAQGGEFSEYWLPNECILCGKTLKKFNGIQSKVEIKKDFVDEDGFIRNYNFFDLYPILQTIFKKYQEEEKVDFEKEFIELFQKNIIGELSINGRKYQKNYNILIIEGSNEIEISQNVKLTRPETFNVKDILECYESIIRIHIDLISSTSQVRNREGLNERYQTLTELKEKLKTLKSKSYDLIIDLTNLFSYKIENRNITIIKEEINLKDLFPNTLIIKLPHTQLLNDFINNNINNQDLKKLLLKK